MRHILLSVVLTTFGAAGLAADPVPGVQRFHAYEPTLAASGQPGRDHFKAIAAAGYKVVVNVGAPGSNPDALRNEKELVEAAGMEYHAIPLRWEKPDAVRVVEAVRLVRAQEGKPVLVHCYVNARASLVAYLVRSTRPGADEAQERATMVQIWKQNRGYEFENAPEWQFALEDARKLLAR